MKKWCSYILIILLVGVLSGCSFAKEQAKKKEYEIVDEQIKTYLSERYGEEFEVIGHEEEYMPGAFEKYKRAICRPVNTPEIEFITDYTYGYYIVTFNTEVGETEIKTYGEKLCEEIFKGDNFEVKGSVLFKEDDLGRRVTLEDLTNRHEELGVSVSMDIDVYGNYDEVYIKEKLVNIGNALIKDFGTVYSLTLSIYPEDTNNKSALIGAINVEEAKESFKEIDVSVGRYKKMEDGRFIEIYE